jgi:hypothetical protein
LGTHTSECIENLRKEPILASLLTEANNPESSKAKEYKADEPQTMVEFLQEEVEWLFEGHFLAFSLKTSFFLTFFY